MEYGGGFPIFQNLIGFFNPHQQMYLKNRHTNFFFFLKLLLSNFTEGHICVHALKDFRNQFQIAIPLNW